jgi:very-short-patch-repair endonuclease/intein/homing endonuclease
MPIKLSLGDESPKGRKRLANAKGQITQQTGFNKNAPSGYASGALCNQPITRNAQFAGGGAGIAMSQPMFFSPLHTPQNWQIASRRKEIYQWARFYYENEPKVAAGVDFYCFTPHTPILMHDGGSKAICDIKVGDRVRSANGSVNRVEKTFVREVNEEILKIRIAGISLGGMEVTKGHELLSEKNGEIVYRKAEELVAGDFLLTPIEYDNNSQDVDDSLARLLGLYAAEGCAIPYEHISKRGRKTISAKGVYFYFSLDEKETLAKEVKELVAKRYGHTASIIELPESGTTKVAVYGSDIADDLCGLCPGSSSDGNKRLSPAVMNWSAKSLTILLGGFADGDGCYSDDNGLQIVGVSTKLMSQMTNICERLGLVYSFTKTRVSQENRQTIYCLRISRRDCHQVTALKVQSVRDVDMQFAKNTPYQKTETQFIRRKIKSIKPFQYSGLVYDFEVEFSHSYIAHRVAVHNSQFTMNGFELECKNKQIRTYYEDVVKTLKLNYWLKLISHEYFLIGDVFPFLEIECKHCHGSGKLPSGSPCNHPDGKFKSVTVLNPDFIEVEDSPFPDQRALKMVPDDNIKRIVATGEPRAAYDRIPDQIRKLVSTGQPIPLSSRSASHIKHSETPYAKYGTSLLRRLFTVLAYKTKLMTANWIIAERLVLPVRVVKIGDKERPASADDIAEVQQQMAAVANDPNLTIVTHHAFEYDWYGSSGKIHNIQGEIEQIGKEILDGLMLNQALLNGEMGGYSCHDTTTKTLTDSGFKFIDDISENDKIACYNPETQKLEYHNYIAKHIYHYDGKMVKFATDKIDICVTPNHRMFAKQRGQDNYSFIEARDIRPRASFIGAVDGFDGDYISTVKIGEEELSIYDYCELVGLYVSEGFIGKNRKNNASYVLLCQNRDGKARKRIFDISSKLHNSNRSEVYETDNFVRFRSPDIAQHLKNECGISAQTKRLPQFIKNLTSECLEIVIDALIAGDGCDRHDANRKTQDRTLYTASYQLAQDFQEIAFKAGYVTSLSKRTARGSSGKFNKKGYEYINKLDMYSIVISKGFKGRKPTLCSKARKTSKKEITSELYNGKVYCFTVPHGLFVTERNGKITIQGNSAQVGIETLIRRLEGWRHTLADWVEDHIFRPLAMMQGFIDEDATKELGKTVYLYPVIKWNDMQLRDKTNKLQMFMQLQDKSLISVETLLNEFDIDYDTEIERIRNQQMISSPGGAPGGATGAMPGGAGGGMPGGMGAPMDPMGGAGGAPPMGGPPGGGMGGPPGGAPMGGAPGGGGGGGMGGMASGGGSGKVFKKGKAPKGPKPEDMPVQPASFVKLTRIEQKLWSTLQQMQLPFKLFGQYKQQVYGQQQPYVMDFALPEIKVDIESDGSIWHDRPDQKQRDAERDRKLAANGWRVIRFTEDAINAHLGEVQKVIEENIREAAEERFSQRKKASSSEHVKYASSDTEELSDEQLRNLVDVVYYNYGSAINNVYGSIVQVIKKEANDETFQSTSDSWTEENQGSRDQLEGDVSGEE